MTSRWKIITAGALGAVLLFTGGFFTSQALPESPQALMVVTAAGLTASDLDSNVQHISISGVDTQATLFTDRPERLAGQVSTDKLLTVFFTNYPTDPPNVTISMLVDGAPHSRVVKLANPEWDGKTLMFESSPLTNDPLGVIPSQASDISITVDDVSQLQPLFSQPPFANN